MKTTCFGNAPLLEEVKKKLGLVIKDGAITTNKIKDGAVTESKLAEASVSTEKIKDGAVTTEKISDGAVNEFKLGNGVVTLEKLSNALAEIILNGGKKKWVIPVWDLSTYPNSLDGYNSEFGDPANLLTVGDYAIQGNYLYKYEGEDIFTMQDLSSSDFTNVLFLDIAEIESFESVEIKELYKLYTYNAGVFQEVSACDLRFDYVNV